MPRAKKDAKYLNIYLSKHIYDEFDEFCKEIGQTKTMATERALEMYMKEMQGKLSNNK